MASHEVTHIHIELNASIGITMGKVATAKYATKWHVACTLQLTASREHYHLYAAAGACQIALSRAGKKVYMTGEQSFKLHCFQQSQNEDQDALLNNLTCGWKEKRQPLGIHIFSSLT